MKLKALFLLALSLLSYSCDKCEDNVYLGGFNLLDSSKSFIPYSGTETLTFIDNNGVEHDLNSEEGKTLELDKMIVRLFCDDGFLERAEMFYDIEREQVAYSDSSGNQVFRTDLTTTFIDNSSLDSIAIYDQLSITATVNDKTLGKIRIVTNERRNQITDTLRQESRLDQTRLIGDTLLYNQVFTDVFVNMTEEGKGIYYNKEKGVVALMLSEEDFWVLKE